MRTPDLSSAKPQSILAWLPPDSAQNSVQPPEDMAAEEEVTYRSRFPVRLGKSSYSLPLSLSRFSSHLDVNYEWHDNALIFHVFNTKQEDFVGSSWLDAKVDIVRHTHQR